MFIVPLPFIVAYIEELAKALKHYRPHRDLSDSQKTWLKYCLMGIMLTNTVCWAAFERVGLGGGYRPSALSWMFRHSGLPWHLLLASSVSLVLDRLGLKSGSLDLDDTDHRRASRRRRFMAHIRCTIRKQMAILTVNQLFFYYW